MPVVPRNKGEWGDLALMARHTRALLPPGYGLRTLVAGTAWLATLTTSSYTCEKLLTFNDQGEEFLQLVAGTYHPQGQLGPCPCGSGKVWLDCHAIEFENGQPCRCGSGRLFDGCHSLARDRSTAQPAPA